MSSYVRALYDFSGEANTSEISITTGEILTVTRTDVGEGWWEGKNTKGQVGLFPAAYVEVLSAVESAQIANGGAGQNKVTNNAPPAMPPQMAAAAAPAPAGARYDQTADEWNDAQDDWEDDWDDDNDTYSEIGPASANQNNNNNAKQGQVNYATMNLPPTPSDDAISWTSGGASTAPSTNANTATLKKSGMFAKSSDSYIMASSNPAVPDGQKVFIMQVDNNYVWEPITESYTVRVTSPKKETKFKGMKSFIAYQLTPSFNNIAVSRRYKHFDWLHERLVEKFCLIPIPPLPDKQISGRYEESFIEHRRAQLQEFIDWMCRHPVLSRCEVWRHFLTCTDEKLWKQGKRTAERDPLVGVTYCAAICPPERQLLNSYVDGQMESCASFVHHMDTAVKSLLTISAEQTKRHQLQAKKDFQRIGEGLSELARALEIDERRVPSTNSFASTVGKMAGLFINIGQMYGEQPKYDWIPFADRLHLYRGILGSFPDILSTHKNAIQKRKECQRLAADQRMHNAQLAEVDRRVDVISYAVLAEMSHFRHERDHHLKEMLRNLIDAQIGFYQNIIAKLQAAQSQFQ